jgi:hypothetical protein
VITYGPGSIIEGVEGPRVIPRPDLGLFFKNPPLVPDEFEISDQRMSQGLLAGAGIFRLPSNAELGEGNNRYIYRTKAFPTWRLCINMQKHNGNYYILHQYYRCPVCESKGRRGSEPIRFIKACSAGHMDEVDWYFLAHGEDKTCEHRDWLRWYGGGGSLSQVRIECPKCNKSVINLGAAYGNEWRCSGRYPEKETGNQPFRQSGCEQKAKIIQRQASNLRIPELLTLFAVYPRHTVLHNILQRKPIYYTLIGNEPTSPEQLQSILKRLETHGDVSRDTFESIIKYPWKEIQTAIKEVLQPVSTSYHDLILEEYKCLIGGSLNGIPPTRGASPQSPVLIEINPSFVNKCVGPSGNILRVTPISKLTTVTVQKGYRREVYTKSLDQTREMAKLVDVSFQDPVDSQKRWYPGVQYLGEGIFFTFFFTDFKVSNKATEWATAYAQKEVYPEYVFRDPANREELQPLFVWWHTFSHLLIREMASETGYSAASIRERIYIDDSGTAGGILFYATQPGSEGTLGGLTALVPHFQEIIDGAMNQLDMCSADPLCREHQFKIGDYNGAACYGCLLLSETSCAHRNMWLDRNILLENMP